MAVRVGGHLGLGRKHGHLVTAETRSCIKVTWLYKGNMAQTETEPLCCAAELGHLPGIW